MANDAICYSQDLGIKFLRPKRLSRSPFFGLIIVATREQLKLYANLLLETLKTFGGRAQISAVREEIAKRLPNEGPHLEIDKRGQPKFVVDLATTKHYLLRGGFLLPSERGIWELSERGRNALALSETNVKSILEQNRSQLPNPIIGRYERLSVSEYDALEAATGYMRGRQNGAVMPFPYFASRRLLSSTDSNLRTSGLYLVSTLPREEIINSFFGFPDCHEALAHFLVAETILTINCNDTQVGLKNFRVELVRQWSPPERLLELSCALFRHHGGGDRAPSSEDSNSSKNSPKSIGLIIHGTWATTESWWKPKTGSYWNFIASYWPHLYDGPTPFSWSGANSHVARLTAAKELISWCDKQNAGSIDIIAHSHGGNVCLLAARAGLKINRLILLGTPIRTEYMIDLSRISSIRNVFSLNDHTQTPLGSFPNTRFDGRTLGDSTAVSNWRSEDNGHGKGPSHSELHEPSTWAASNLTPLLN